MQKEEPSAESAELSSLLQLNDKKVGLYRARSYLELKIKTKVQAYRLSLEVKNAWRPSPVQTDGLTPVYKLPD